VLIRGEAVEEDTMEDMSREGDTKFEGFLAYVDELLRLPPSYVLPCLGGDGCGCNAKGNPFRIVCVSSRIIPCIVPPRAAISPKQPIASV